MTGRKGKEAPMSAYDEGPVGSAPAEVAHEHGVGAARLPDPVAAQPEVRVTLGSIYGQVQNMATKVDRIDHRTANLDALLSDHERRIRNNERWVFGMAGGLAVVGSFAAAATTITSGAI